MPHQAQRPLGVSILSGLVLISGLTLLASGAFLLLVPPLLGGSGVEDFINSPLLLIVLQPSRQIIIDLALGVSLCFLATSLGLWIGSNLARIFFMLIQVLLAVGSLMFLGVAPVVSEVGVTATAIVLVYLHLPRVHSYFECLPERGRNSNRRNRRTRGVGRGSQTEFGEPEAAFET